MTKKKKFRPQKTFSTVTDAVSFRSIEPSYERGTFTLTMRIWKKVRGHSTTDIHDIKIVKIDSFQLANLLKQMQEAIKKDLASTVEMANRFWVTP